MKEKIKCTLCDKILREDKIKWLELSNTNGEYYIEIPKDHVSQGGFPFGLKCANKVLKHGK